MTRPHDPGETAADLTFLRTVLNEWGPYCPVRQGAPEDEFDSERERIHQALVSGEVKSQAALAEHILAIYTDMFGDVFTPEECFAVAHKIWPWWQAKQRR